MRRRAFIVRARLRKEISEVREEMASLRTRIVPGKISAPFFRAAMSEKEGCAKQMRKEVVA
jgi:hypothetical protein